MSLCMTVAPRVAGAQQRVTMSLNGTWEVAESVSSDRAPDDYPHTAPVPGLVRLASPAFEDVDAFLSREHLRNGHVNVKIDTSGLAGTAGISLQDRDYYWYRTNFRTPDEYTVARLVVNKAQFGVAVWLNGKKVGEHLHCFTPGKFDLSDAIDWSGENTLVVRVGAHPGMLPLEVACGTDTEKIHWTAGIYDDVSLLLSDDVTVESVQAAPRIGESEVLVQTRIKNRGGEPRTFALTQRVYTWKGGQEASPEVSERLTLTPGEEQTVTQTISLRNARLWSPEDPFLYVLATSTGADSAATRFGMREFRTDTATKRAYLNGKPIFLRGSNITLHRFFEDPALGPYAWDDAWIRKLLVDLPDRMHWNAFRFCIGPVPQRWLDAADEAGLLIQNEFFIWFTRPEWDAADLVRQYADWMEDNWNHPSVAIWDANNETTDPELFDRIIPAVRDLDLSDRPWDNGYNLPVGPNDIVEDHPYGYGVSEVIGNGRYGFMEALTAPKSVNAPHPSAHPVIINEYGWLWVHRDGAPTRLTANRGIYPEEMSGPEKIERNAYLLAAETEMWRSHRNAAGVLHFVYLTSDHPDAFTADHFRDVRRLELHEPFEKYVSEAFKPLGVYLNLWQPAVRADSVGLFPILTQTVELPRTYGPNQAPVMIVNDHQETMEGSLSLVIERADGEVVHTVERLFSVPALGQMTYLMDLILPPVPGSYRVMATAKPKGAETTTSFRRVEVIPAP